MDCNVPMCRECKFTTHANHKLQNADELPAEYSGKVNTIVELIQGQIERTDSQLTNMEAYEAEFKDSIKLVSKEVTNRASLLHQMVDDYQKNLMDELKEVSQVEEGEMENRRETMTMTLSSLKSIRDLAGKISNHGRPPEVMTMVNELEKQLQVLDKHSAQTWKYTIAVSFPKIQITKEDIAKVVEVFGSTLYRYRETMQDGSSSERSSERSSDQSLQSDHSTGTVIFTGDNDAKEDQKQDVTDGLASKLVHRQISEPVYTQTLETVSESIPNIHVEHGEKLIPTRPPKSKQFGELALQKANAKVRSRTMSSPPEVNYLQPDIVHTRRPSNVLSESSQSNSPQPSPQSLASRSDSTGDDVFFPMAEMHNSLPGRRSRSERRSSVASTETRKDSTGDESEPSTSARDLRRSKSLPREKLPSYGNFTVDDIAVTKGKLVKSILIERIRVSGIASNSKEDTILVDWQNKKVHMMDKNFRYKQPIGGERGPGKLVGPCDVAVTKKDYIIVTDSDGKCVKVYNPEGLFVKEFGRDLVSPSGVAVNSRDDVVVVDRETATVHVYNVLGRLQRTLRCDHKGRAHFKRPLYVTISNSDDIIVSDFGNHCLKVFDMSGHLKFTYGSPGSLMGQVWGIHGVCVDGFDNILVADCSNNRIHLVTPSGKFRGFLAAKESDLMKPTALTTNSEGELIVGEKGGNLKVYKYLKTVAKSTQV